MNYSLIQLNEQKLYDYFNAQTNWQKNNINSKIATYKKLLVKYIIERKHYTSGLDLYQFPHDKFSKEVGLQAVYGTKPLKREHFVKVIQNTQPQYTLIAGSNLTQKVSLMATNFNIDLLVQTNSIDDLLIAKYGDVDITDPNVVDIVPINIKSLKAYMKANEALPNRNTTIIKYYKDAQEILMTAIATNGVLPQVITESEYGRRYYRGLNLQNVSKVVREAALGPHYEYDLNAAVYAIKTNICSLITNQKFTYTSEYIEGGGKFKDSIRKRLALACFKENENDKYFKKNVERIKQAITAIGFGATRSSKGYYQGKDWKPVSLELIFGYYTENNGRNMHNPLTKQVLDDKGNMIHKKCIDIFLEDSWMKHFYEEQAVMTKTICDYMKESKQVTKESHSFLVDGRNAINNNKLMALVFQTSERAIMDFATKEIESQGVKILLRVHDALFTDKRIDMQELHHKLHEVFVSESLAWLGKRILSFEETEAQGFYFDDELYSHKERIRQEEIRAGGRSLGVKPLDYKIVSYSDDKAYSGETDYGQTEYDPEHDPYIQDMNEQELMEHYRIVGYKPSNNILPEDIRRLL